MQAFEIWEDPGTHVRFYFSHSDQQFTTGVMVIPPHTELPKHNRPLAIENLVQISGACLMKVFDENDKPTDHILNVGDNLSMRKGQFHIHANPNDEPSATLFKAVGDITAVVDTLRQNFTRIELKQFDVDALL
jgi:quercetin dioxygenase-like cupin family protein